MTGTPPRVEEKRYSIVPGDMAQLIAMMEEVQQMQTEDRLELADLVKKVEQLRQSVDDALALRAS